MDFDELRGRFSKPEFKQLYADVCSEPRSAIIERMQRMDRREKRKRITLLILARTPFAIILGLEAVRLFVTESRSLPSQPVAFILELAVIFALQWVDKAREKYELPKLWLAHREYLLDEQHRLKKIIRFDQCNSVSVCLAIIGLAMYAAPLLSAGLRIACWIATGAAVLALQIYDRRKISQLKQERDIVAAELDELAATDLTETVL
jgi:hypothetical protein